jgi:hypothetical protein
VFCCYLQSVVIYNPEEHIYLNALLPDPLFIVMKNKNQNRNRRQPNRPGAAQTRMALMGLSTGRMPCPGQPPPYVSNVTLRKVFRFVASTSVTEGTTFVITAAKVCGLLSMGTTATQVTQVFETCKIFSISMWSGVNNAASASNLPRLVSCVFSGAAAGTFGSNITHSDLSVGMTRVGRLRVKPDRSSQASEFQPGATNLTNSYFTLVLGPGVIIDVDAGFICTTDARTASNSVTVASATVGEIYYMALDNAYSGAGSVGNLLTPCLDLATTV